ncbi:MAG: hypothetical protein JXO22_01940 [Phycisphaerae bacterium]|nr:hypothetical protein [Phycisphaerae bacterium]
MPLATQYKAELGQRDTELTNQLVDEVFPAYQRRGYLTKPELLTVCAWKSPRTRPLCQRNDDAFIRDVSSVAWRTASERLRIEVWTLLSGVSWPTASVFLHFAFPDRYPILDFRALWSVGLAEPNQYHFGLWWEYTEFCCAVAKQADVSMRELDEALWKYSELNQKM